MTEWLTVSLVAKVIFAIFIIAMLVYAATKVAKTPWMKGLRKKSASSGKGEKKDDKSSAPSKSGSGWFRKLTGALGTVGAFVLTGFIVIVLIGAVIFGWQFLSGIWQEINRSPAEIAASGAGKHPSRNSAPRAAADECPPFSATGATCEVPPTCRWIRNEPGRSTELSHEFLPRMTSSSGEKRYTSVRYLDTNGVVHDWNSGQDLRRMHVEAWQFCPKQTITMTYSLATPRS